MLGALASGCLALVMGAPPAAGVVGAATGPATGGTTGPLVPFYRPVSMAAVTLADPGVVVTPNQDVPDPYVIETNGVYVMFSSQDGYFSPNVPVRVSYHLTDWTTPPIDAMPTLPSWAQPGFTWSPDVLKVHGHYVMWFNAALAASGTAVDKCIGVATSTSVVGPYRSLSPHPLVCQLDHLGSIDPRAFVDPTGHLWLVWKSDDNADLNAQTHTTIWVQRLSDNGLALLGQPVALLTADLPWEGRIVESPDMVYAAGHYWLFFSGNWFNEPNYGMGLAECASVTGPCEPTTLGAWFSSNAQGAGPGEESLFFDNRRWWMFYAPFAVDYQSMTPRPAAVVRLVFGQDGPRVVPPGTSAWTALDRVPKPKPRTEVAAARGRCRHRCRAPGAGRFHR